MFARVQLLTDGVARRWDESASWSSMKVVQGHHPEHGVDVFRDLRCVDGGNVVFPPFDRAAMREAVEAEVRQLSAERITPVVIGDDHSVTLPVLFHALGRLPEPEIAHRFA